MLCINAKAYYIISLFKEVATIFKIDVAISKLMILLVAYSSIWHWIVLFDIMNKIWDIAKVSAKYAARITNV